MNKNTASTNSLDLFHVSWRSYNILKTKALDASPMGLFISLSIAFFVVISASYLLNIFYYQII